MTRVWSIHCRHHEYKTGGWNEKAKFGVKMALTVNRIFRELMTKNQPIMLINQFNGVSVANNSMVLGFNNTSVKISVNKYQGVVLQQEHQTLMVTDYCESSILAKVDYVNLAAREAYLTDFRFVEKLFNVREQVRIKPRHEIIAAFPEILEVQGKVFDISLNGLSVYIPREDTNYEKFVKGRQIQVDLKLPLNNGEKSALFDGIIRKIFLESEESRVRIGLQTLPDETAKNAISTYITQNMLAICGELSNLYNEQVQEPIYLSNLGNGSGRFGPPAKTPFENLNGGENHQAQSEADA